jgi:DnaK suppressor protein
VALAFRHSGSRLTIRAEHVHERLHEQPGVATTWTPDFPRLDRAQVVAAAVTRSLEEAKPVSIRRPVVWAAPSIAVVLLREHRSQKASIMQTLARIETAPIRTELQARLDRHAAQLEHCDPDNPRARHHREAIAEIATAIARINSEHYGICLACGTRIPSERLDARPEATTCVHCHGRKPRLIG